MKAPTTFSALLEAFFLERLMQQRQVSAHTIASYRDAFRLLLQFAQKRLHKAPSSLAVSDLTTKFLGEFLDHLEIERGNTATCGARGRDANSDARHFARMPLLCYAAG